MTFCVAYGTFIRVVRFKLLKYDIPNQKAVTLL